MKEPKDKFMSLPMITLSLSRNRRVIESYNSSGECVAAFYSARPSIIKGSSNLAAKRACNSEYHSVDYK